MTNHKAKITFTIPTISTDANILKSRDDGYDFLTISSKIETFIKNSLPEFGVAKPNLFLFQELVKNVYDAHVAKGLALENPLIITVVVKEKVGSVVVELKDNASGFIDQPRSIIFPLRKIKYSEKNSSQGFFGGAQLGLKFVQEDLRDHDNGLVFFKNRKKEGATVSLCFLPLPKEHVPKAKL